jgi:small subunit ribosomal protein S20
MKKCFLAVSAYGANPEPEALKTAEEAMSEAFSKIDKAVKRNVIHKNNGARKKAGLARALKKVTMAS